MPIVTGQDAEIASVKLIADGVQFATIFKDTRKLADQAVVAASAYLAGEEPEANDTESYDNGVKVVPSFLLESDIVYTDNIESLLVDSGYWTGRRGRQRPGRLITRPTTPAGPAGSPPRRAGPRREIPWNPTTRTADL